jgi:triacylglycerol lipase
MFTDQPAHVWGLAFAALLAVIVLLWLARRRWLARPQEPGKPREAPFSDEPSPDLEPLPSAPAAPLIVLRRPAPTRYPLVLAHGYFGFDSIGVPRMRQEYFRGVRARLEALGHVVHVARVSPAAGIEVRARQLATQIEAFGAERVNIIAHSMGGLDARYAIARLGLGQRVASLTTIGTPHQGTPLADRCLVLGELRGVRRMLSTLGANIDGLYDVTTQNMQIFNSRAPDSADVVYTSVVGSVLTRSDPINALLLPGHAYLSKIVGANDGIVPASSQRWGEVLHEVSADHWAQIGWSRVFDARSFYVALAERLAERGL